MAYRLVTVPWGDEVAWGARLLEELAHQEREGYVLSAMTPRTMAIRHAAGGPTHYSFQLVCVLHKEETP